MKMFGRVQISSNEGEPRNSSPSPTTSLARHLALFHSSSLSPSFVFVYSLAPHYEEAATELKSKNIKLAKVDCTVEAELCQDFGIQGYP